MRAELPGGVRGGGGWGYNVMVLGPEIWTIVNQRNIVNVHYYHWNCGKGSVGETSERK